MGLTKADLITIAKRTGYPVREAWAAGHGEMGTVVGFMEHHTGTPDTVPGDLPTLGWLQDGMELGTCCNFALARSGTIYLVSERIAWHAGVGEFEGIRDGNGHFLACEAESGGAGVWSSAQRDCYPRLAASVLLFIGQPIKWAIRHARWALPVGRKSDTAGMDFSKVAGYLANPSTITRGTTQEDDMFEIGDRHNLSEIETLARETRDLVRDVRPKGSNLTLIHDYLVKLLGMVSQDLPDRVATLITDRPGEITPEDVKAAVKQALDEVANPTS